MTNLFQRIKKFFNNKHICLYKDEFYKSEEDYRVISEKYEDLKSQKKYHEEKLSKVVSDLIYEIVKNNGFKVICTKCKKEFLISSTTRYSYHIDRPNELYHLGCYEDHYNDYRK